MENPKKPARIPRLEQAVNYVLAHPDETKLQQAMGSGFSESTIAHARAYLVREGKLPESRKATPMVGLPFAPAEASSPAAVGLSDHEAMLAMAEIVDLIDTEDDTLIQKRLAKQALTFAFNTKLHPDTRMSASQMYYKLRDIAKAKELGPGKPKTYAIGVERLTEMLVACGPEMTMDAVAKAFTIREGVTGANEPSSVSEGILTPPTSEEPGSIPTGAPQAVQNDAREVPRTVESTTGSLRDLPAAAEQDLSGSGPQPPDGTDSGSSL